MALYIAPLLKRTASAVQQDDSLRATHVAAHSISDAVTRLLQGQRAQLRALGFAQAFLCSSYPLLRFPSIKFRLLYPKLFRLLLERCLLAVVGKLLKVLDFTYQHASLLTRRISSMQCSASFSNLAPAALTLDFGSSLSFSLALRRLIAHRAMALALGWRLLALRHRM